MDTKISVERYLQETIIPLRLATATTTGWPVVLSLWYLFEEGSLYCATQQQAQVVTYLLQEPRCGFEVAADQPPYCGVRGRAIATIEPQRGIEILRRLLIRYLGNDINQLAQKLLSRPTPEVAIRIDLQSSSTWNFSNRMADTKTSDIVKMCPD